MFQNSRNNEDGGWLSLSDMMTVLMVLFLIISVTIAVTSTTRLAKMRGVLSYVTNQEDLLCEQLEDNPALNLLREICKLNATQYE